MSRFIVSAKKMFESYKIWVSENPQTVGDFETTFKWVSYFLAGRISNSSVTTELIYSLSNMLVLFNDRIIEKASQVQPLAEGVVYKIKLMLTTLEYCEVFIEISAKKLYGQRGRWFFIVIVQLLKSCGRFFLLQKCSESIINVPPIPNLNRKKIHEKQNQTQNQLIEGENTFTFKLKRSGRVVRKVEGAPPMHQRSFIPVSKQENLSENEKENLLFFKAESFYIAKPLVHLGAIGLFGYRNWKSFSVALLMDLASIRIYYQNRNLLSQKQKVELSKRCVNLLLYLVRSPFYEKRTQKTLNSLLAGVANTIPFSKTICNPLMQYIPQWQNTYFYMWST